MCIAALALVASSGNNNQTPEFPKQEMIMPKEFRLKPKRYVKNLKRNKIYY